MKIVFVGGRQARTLCEIYRGLSGGEAHWIDGGLPLGPANAARLEAADKLALQETGNPPPPDWPALAANAERVSFPELTLDFLWPFGGQPHAANTADALFPTGPFPAELGDAWLNRRLAGRQQLEAVEAEYLGLDVAATVDLDACKTLTLQRQAEIDAACGADFASRLAEDFRRRPLFDNPLAPGPKLLRDLANWTFARLELPYTLTRDWRPTAGAPETPLHPSLVSHFGLAWAQSRPGRLVTGEAVDFAEYVRRYLAYAEGPELERGAASLALGQADAALPLLATAAARPMGRRCATARSALAAALLAAERSGDIAVLRDAAALRPNDAEAQSRLTVALAAAGDTAGAIRSAEAEIAAPNWRSARRPSAAPTSRRRRFCRAARAPSRRAYAR